MFGRSRSKSATQLVAVESFLFEALRFASLPIFVTSSAPGEGLVFANAAFVKGMGAASHADLLGKSVDKLFHSRQRDGRSVAEMLKAFDAGIKAHGNHSGPCSYLRLDGTAFETIATVATFTYGAKSYSVTQLQDIASALAMTQRKEEMTRLASQFEGQVSGVMAAVSTSATQLQSMADTLSTNAARASSQTATVADSARGAQDNVAVVAAAAEELGASINEIREQVGRSAAMLGEAVQEAQQSAKLVQDLSEAAARIGAVVEMISSIAAQTNLLALNATIEAARAGEAGKGFAVVASEVKALANQTSKATAEISEHITAIQGSTQRAVGAIGGIGKTINSVNEIATALRSGVEQQDQATREIIGSIDQAATGTGTVSRTITAVAAASSETGVAASRLLDASTNLSGQATRLQGEVANFLQTVRAA